MTIWYKQGVEGDLSNQCQKCLGRIHTQGGRDILVTAKRDGNHMAGSLHYNGNAFDFRPLGFVKEWYQEVAGGGFDIVVHQDHIHIEYDPKSLKQDGTSEGGG